MPRACNRSAEPSDSCALAAHHATGSDLQCQWTTDSATGTDTAVTRCHWQWYSESDSESEYSSSTVVVEEEEEMEAHLVLVTSSTTSRLLRLFLYPGQA
jgi:hypothetical protein